MLNVMITVFCPDRPGLVSAIAGRLFDLGGNLGDASFAVLGGSAEFSAICHLPPHVAVPDLQSELQKLPELADAAINVQSFGAPAHAKTAEISHVVTVSGGDRPGLIARLAEIFAGYKVNIVRMDAQTLPESSQQRYVIRFALAMPASAVAGCLAAIDSTAGEMGLSCGWTEEKR